SSVMRLPASGATSPRCSPIQVPRSWLGVGPPGTADEEPLGEVMGVAPGVGDDPTTGSGPDLKRTNAPAMATTAAAPMANGMRFMVVDRQVRHRHDDRACGAVSTAWRTGAIARSGASSGLVSSQAR